jgi:hypothetical protein
MISPLCRKYWWHDSQTCKLSSAPTLSEGIEGVGFSRTFGSFKQLTKFHTLHLDLELLIDDEQGNLFENAAMLPSNLKGLTVIENAYVVHKFPRFCNDQDGNGTLSAS